jgi:group II intron reverse transcriptase/maturase
MGMWSLSHHIDIEWLTEAYRRTRKNGAVGVDGQTAEEYAKNLQANLAVLLDRAKGGTYRAPPVKRVNIPKGTGKETRPIGIPTFEDKVLQRAVVMALEPIYEQDFLDCSYGFRPERSAHQALEVLREHMMKMRGGWVLELDIRKYFDTMVHRHIQELVRRRVRDGVLLRLIGKWLNAGVMADGTLEYPDAGTPQGGVVSPLLANIYLHEVLDVWFEREVRPRLRGQAHMVRYADDAVLVFETEEDARRVLAALPKRFEKFGLTLHPGEDAAGSVRSTAQGWSGQHGDVRLPRVHAPLGEKPERELGHQAKDRRQSVHPRASANRAVVPGKPARAAQGAAARPQPEATRALPVLRHHGQQPGPWPLQARGPEYLAEVAGSPIAARMHVAAFPGAARAFPPATGHRSPLEATSRSEPMT